MKIGIINITIDKPENPFNSRGKLHWMKNLYLRFKYGAGCCDVFSLDYYLAKRIIEPLKVFRQKVGSHPMDLTSEQWDEYLDDMIFAFEFLLDEERSKKLYMDNSHSLYERQQRGFEYFGKYYLDLWM